MNRIFLLIGIGGFIGSVLRYYSQQLVSRFFPSTLPFGTLAVNIAGCLIIGIIYGLSERGNTLTPELRLLLATGFCGGFTTFSAFSYESIKLMSDGEWMYLALYVTISVVAGLAATFIGITITRSI